MAERKGFMLRLDPSIYDALTRWAGDELRSTNAQVEYLLREALARTGRLPATRGRMPRRSRSPEAKTAPRLSDQDEAPHPVAD